MIYSFHFFHVFDVQKSNALIAAQLSLHGDAKRKQRNHRVEC